MSLAARFEKLSAREQRLLGVLGIALAALVVLGIPYSLAASVLGARGHNEELRAQLARIERASPLLAERRAAREARDLLYSKPGMPLASFIENAAKAQGIDVPESSDQPDVTVKGYVERSTQAKFRKVGLKALVSALEQMEKSGNAVAVTALHVSARSQPDEYDVSLTVSQYERKAKDGKKGGADDAKPKAGSP